MKIIKTIMKMSKSIWIAKRQEEFNRKTGKLRSLSVMGWRCGSAAAEAKQAMVIKSARPNTTERLVAKIAIEKNKASIPTF